MKNAICYKKEYFLTLIGVHGYSGKADATAQAPDSLVHFVIPIKNSRPKIIVYIYI